MITLKCPICGAPVPPSDVGRPRKFCSTKCAVKAAHEYRKARGRRFKEKIHRKVCAFCGDVFMANHNRQRFCSFACSARSRSKASDRLLAEMAKDRERKCRRLEQCRETAPVTVECVRTTDGRTLVVETRGQRCIGWRSVGRVNHM